MTTQSIQGVTLEEVFAALSAKRVPMAPELAGYLALGVAEGLPASNVRVEPQRVWIGEDGVVHVLIPRGTAVPGDAEADVRGFIGALFEVTGQKTPALVASSRKKSGGNLRAFETELVSALIPVNRSAGKRALARLAREVARAGVPLTTVEARTTPGPSAHAAPASDVVRVPERAPVVERSPAVERAPVVEIARAATSTHWGMPMSSLGEDEMTPPPRAVAAAPMRPHTATIVDVAPPAVFADAKLRTEVGTFVEPPTFVNTPPLFDAIAPVAPVGATPVGVPDGAAAVADVEGSPEDDMDFSIDVDFEPAPSVASVPSTASMSESKEVHDEAWVAIPDHGYDDFDLPLPPSKFVTLSDPLLPAFHVPPPSDRHLSDELRALVGVDRTPPPTPESPVEGPPAAFVDAFAEADEDLHENEEALADHVARLDGRDADSLRPFARSAPEIDSDATDDPRLAKTGPARMPRVREDERDAALHADADVSPRPRTSRTRNALRTAALVASASLATVSILWAASGRPGSTGSAKSPARAEETSALFSMERAPACLASLTVSDVPAHAEVLLRVGQAPLDVERMPVGARLEFVALADGHVPRRAIVPANAAWESDPQNRPRFELGVQLDVAKTRAQTDAWPAFESGTEVGGKGTPGTVHVVASPKGSEVWLLAGTGPEAHIEQLGCGSDVDVLVAGPGTFRKRIHVPASDFTVDGAQGNAKSEVRLARASVRAVR